jgi:hypothetical protein
MATFSERSFGARLQKAKNILSYMQGFSNYNPPEADQQAAAFGNFLDDVMEANMSETELQQKYEAAVQTRLEHFRVGSASLLKLLAPIRGAVEAKFGKDSQEYKAVSKIINTMTAAKLVSAANEPQGGEAGEGEGEAGGQADSGGAQPQGQTPGEAISKSQQSFGSLLGYFNDLITVLSQLNGYNPSKNALKVANLQSFAATLELLNTNVATKFQQLHQQRAERLALYDELGRKVQKIKAYVKSEYGVDSEPYKLLKGLSM